MSNEIEPFDIGVLISRAVAQKLDAAFVEKEVEKRIETLVIDAVDVALRCYSDTGKTITTAVENALKVNRLDLPSYGLTVCNMLKLQIESRVSDLVSDRLAKDMDELLNLAPKEIKLSKIAEMMREDDDEKVITVHLEETIYGSHWLYLDSRQHYSEREKHSCEARIMLDKKTGTISGAWLDDRDLKSTRVIGHNYGLKKMICSWYACGTKIILDMDDVVTSGMEDY